jgi:gas vesicle protein
MNKLTIGLLGLFSGFSLGTLVGILYAPDTGTNTRDKITYQLDKYKEMLEELLDELVQGKNMQSNTARSEGQKVISDAKEKAEKLLIDVEDLLSQIKKQK